MPEWFAHCIVKKALYEKTKFNYQNCSCWKFLIYSVSFHLSVEYPDVLFQTAASKPWSMIRCSKIWIIQGDFFVLVFSFLLLLDGGKRCICSPFNYFMLHKISKSHILQHVFFVNNFVILEDLCSYEQTLIYDHIVQLKISYVLSSIWQVPIAWIWLANCSFSTSPAFSCLDQICPAAIHARSFYSNTNCCAAFPLLLPWGDTCIYSLRAKSKLVSEVIR